MSSLKNLSTQVPKEQLALWTEEVMKKLESQGRVLVATMANGKPTKVSIPKQRK